MNNDHTNNCWNEISKTKGWHSFAKKTEHLTYTCIAKSLSGGQLQEDIRICTGLLYKASYYSFYNKQQLEDPRMYSCRFSFTARQVLGTQGNCWSLVRANVTELSASMYNSCTGHFLGFYVLRRLQSTLVIDCSLSIFCSAYIVLFLCFFWARICAELAC
jgi:hypothetical protein